MSVGLLDRPDATSMNDRWKPRGFDDICDFTADEDGAVRVGSRGTRPLSHPLTASAGLTLSNDATLLAERSCSADAFVLDHPHAVLRSRGFNPVVHEHDVPSAWQRFLGTLTGPDLGLRARHAKALRDLWTYLRVAIGPKLPPPQVEPGEEGSMKLVWSRDSFYAEVELYAEDADGRCLHEWFYRNRDTDQFAGSDEPGTGAPAREFLEFLGCAVRG